MLRLSKTDVVPPRPAGAPPGNWPALCPETKAWVIGGDWEDLKKKYYEHLLSNGVPIPANLSAFLQDLVCRSAPVGWKGCRMDTSTRYLGWEDLVRWGRTMLGSIGREFVPQEEAERRASICAGCRYQTEISGFCSVCSGIPAVMLALVKGKSTSKDEQLKTCSLCACKNSAAVHYPLDVLQKASSGIEWPLDTRMDGQEAVQCWKRD